MGATVLLVEDDPTMRFIEAEALTLMGNDVIECASADDALRVLRKPNHINLVLSDIRMPGDIDGLGLANQIWQSWPQLPVILTSGHLMLSAQAMPDNAAFIAKPWSLDQLQSAVQLQLDRLA